LDVRVNRAFFTCTCVFGLLAATACRAPKLAGESVGTFVVTGTLNENTCAAGYPAPETFSFRVDIRRERNSSSVGYWKLPQGPLMAGTVDDAGAFRFTQIDEVVAVPADPSTGQVGCTLLRTEVVTGAIPPSANASDLGDADRTDGGGEAASALSGTTAIEVEAVAGSDCSALLLPSGGAFPVLPCELSWSFSGTREP
jgi:hypothetical protein